MTEQPDPDADERARRRRDLQRATVRTVTEALAELAQVADVAAELEDDQAGRLYAAVAALARREADDPRCTETGADHLIAALQAASTRYRDHQDLDPTRLRELLAASTGLTGVLASRLLPS